MARRSTRTSKRKSVNNTSRFYRGEEGMKHAEQVKERQDKQRESGGGRVFRFYVKEGESKEIIILDEKPDFFMWEHNYKEGGHYGNHAGCCKEWETCPACEEYPDSNSYFGMYLSCIDLTQYTDKQGNEVEFTRKLLVVKPSQHKKFSRLYERHGTLRGMVLEMSRDGKKDAGIGNDIQFQEFIDEDDLAEYIREWEDKDGKVHEEDCSEPYEYTEIFDEPTPENIAAQIGVDYEPTPGSSKANRKALDEEESEEDLDEDEEDEKPRSRRRGKARAGKKAPARKGPARRSRKGTTKRRAVDDDDVDEEEDEKEDDNEPPWDEEEGDVEPEEKDEKPSRSRRRRPMKRSRKR